jgi:hypothetical protein
MFFALKVATFDIIKGEFWTQIWYLIFKFNVKDNKLFFKMSKITVSRERKNID